MTLSLPRRTNSTCALIFFDIDNAYPTARRRYILNELIRCGLNGHIIHFINNFLSSKKFKVKVNHNLSEENILANGVPQGSVLSVTLFLLMMNKVINHIKPLIKILLFADDLVIYCKGKSIVNTKQLLQSAITSLTHWSDSTGLQFSKLKTKGMLFCNRRNCTCPTLTLNDANINYTNEIKFLDHRQTTYVVFPHNKIKDRLY